ncbi:MAG: DUF4402 domain-containing protein [Bacteroidetes bacterium]|nr:DUF4402 domain-containing protein [Bacteroidota bacterium]
MKKTIIIIVAIIMAGFSANVMAQATKNTTAGAKIVAPISITETSPLNFGTMAVLASTAGTCVLSTQGVRTATGGVNLSAQTPIAANAAYNVGGAISTTYAITLPSTITVTDGAAHNMTIDNILARTASAGANGLTGTLSVTGTDSFTIGGTLNVTAAQVAAVYAGTFNVTVAYN